MYDTLTGSFMKLPRLIARQPLLSSNAKVVYAWLITSHHADLAQHRRHSNHRIGSDVGMEHFTVSRALQQLKRAGFIELTGTGDRRRIRILPQALPAAAAPAQTAPAAPQRTPEERAMDAVNALHADDDTGT